MLAALMAAAAVATCHVGADGVISPSCQALFKGAVTFPPIAATTIVTTGYALILTYRESIARVGAYQMAAECKLRGREAETLNSEVHSFCLPIEEVTR